MHDDEIQWNLQHPFSEEQEDRLEELQSLVDIRNEPVSAEIWSPVIHRTLESFVNCDNVKKMVAEVEWPLYRFLIAMSINSTADGFREPASVPHIVKKLVYCILANVFEQARRI